MKIGIFYGTEDMRFKGPFWGPISIIGGWRLPRAK
jgi:hypothetical protein